MSQAIDCLSILQYNCMKSKDIVMATLLRDVETFKHSVLAIQEPWTNPFTPTTHHPIRDRFDLLSRRRQRLGRRRRWQESAFSLTRT